MLAALALCMAVVYAMPVNIPVVQQLNATEPLTYVHSPHNPSSSYTHVLQCS